MNPDHLLDQARALAAPRGRKSRQADLGRAVSAAYYALFHALCGGCADQMIGATARLSPTWVRFYRAVEHSAAKAQCRAVQAPAVTLHPGVKEFAAALVELQEERHRADYDPTVRYARAKALGHVERAASALSAFRSASREDRQRFAATILFRAPRQP